ncbi:MAG: Tat pathway signal sequence domain protein [Terricaulis sp.]|nr:Tat pathway signal sequence domain protein [Terricaulis sp.]
MKLQILAALGATLLIAGCASQGRTIELPGGVMPEDERGAPQREPNWLDRALGNDNRQNVGPCPLMGVLYDNARLVQFVEPGVERYANVAFTGEMQGVRGLCRYVGDDPIRMSIAVDMAFGRGPASAGEDRRTYRYWVAVARRGRAPIAKEYFDVEVRFPRGEDTVTRTEEIGTIEIPRANGEISGENFEILIGFELTPEQMQFNRDGKRFRVNAADAVAEASPS